MKCCENVDIDRPEIEVRADRFAFKLILTFCRGCGEVKHPTTFVRDGKLVNGDYHGTR